jgi:mono/diheme cytochrome c family protein
MIIVLQTLLLAACDNTMRDQPKYQPLESSSFFADGKASRDLVEGTIPRGELRIDEHLYTGMVDGKLATSFPFGIDEAVLKRGQERYNIYCSVCHDQLGYGNGMVVQRGFKQPTSFHDDRLINSPDGYFYFVMTNGFGLMNAYDYQITAHDRWAIVAYIRTLQQSQNADFQEAPESERQRLLNAQH